MSNIMKIAQYHYELIINDTVSLIQKSIRKKIQILSSTYVTILAKAWINYFIFLSNFVLVFEKTLYNNVQDSLIPLTPTRSWAVVVFSVEAAETLKSQGRAYAWVL